MPDDPSPSSGQAADFAALCAAFRQELAEQGCCQPPAWAVKDGLIAVLRRMRKPSETVDAAGDEAIDDAMRRSFAGPYGKMVRCRPKAVDVRQAMIDELLRQAGAE